MHKKEQNMCEKRKINKFLVVYYKICILNLLLSAGNFEQNRLLMQEK